MVCLQQQHRVVPGGRLETRKAEEATEGGPRTRRGHYEEKASSELGLRPVTAMSGEKGFRGDGFSDGLFPSVKLPGSKS